MRQALLSLLICLCLTACAVSVTEQGTLAPAATVTLPSSSAPFASSTMLATQPPPATPTPVFTPTPPPWWWPSLEGAVKILPPDAEPLCQRAWEWATPRACGMWWNVIAIPYRLPEGRMSLAAVAQARNPGGGGIEGQHEVVWDWQQETVGPDLWRDIRPLFAPVYSLTFLGQDDDGQWWIGAVHGSPTVCQSISIIALLPVSNPDDVFLDITNFERDAATEFWVVDGDRLVMYQWVDGQAVERLLLEDVPGNTVYPWMQDMTGDGQLELLLRWEGGERALYQIYQVEEEDYQLVGAIEPGLQYADVDGDGVAEFLRPQPADAPLVWEVYGWNEERFAWREPVTLSAPTPVIPDPETLPSLGADADLYFSLGDELWRWPSQGGALQSAEEVPPEPSSRRCDRSLDREAVSWSPDCRFAVIQIPGPAEEGASFGIVDVDNGKTMEIPCSFTYVHGHSTFAWDPQGRFVVYARADGCEGLYRINPHTGAVDTLLPMSGGGLFGLEPTFFGAVGPVVFPDGAIGFTIQGTDPSLYPPNGVYLLTPDRELRLLARVPPISVRDEDGPAYYGGVSWSPDGRAFLYHAPFSDWHEPPYSALLLGRTDGNALWDLNSMVGNAHSFQWQRDVEIRKEVER
jgi:hypothetical protein